MGLGCQCDSSDLGNLFKSNGRQRNKTNLMLFLRPVVVRDAQATEQLSLERYEQLRTEQSAAVPSASVLVPRSCTGSAEARDDCFGAGLEHSGTPA